MSYIATYLRAFIQNIVNAWGRNRPDLGGQINAQNLKNAFDLENKNNIALSENQQTIHPTNGKYGIYEIIIPGISPNYVGSSIPRRSALNRSGGTVTASAGYYSTDVQYTVTESDLGLTKVTSFDASLTGYSIEFTYPANSWTDENVSVTVGPGDLGLYEDTDLHAENNANSYTINIYSDANKYYTSKTIYTVSPTTLGLIKVTAFATSIDTTNHVASISMSAGAYTESIISKTISLSDLGVTTKTESDIIIADNTVTTPKGYYDSAITKTIPVEDLAITENGTYGYGISSKYGKDITVNVPASNVTSGTYTVSSAVTAANIADYKYLTVPASTMTNNTTLPSGVSSNGTITCGKYIKISAGYNNSDKYYFSEDYTYKTNTAATFTNNTTPPSGVTPTRISAGKTLKISAGYNSSDKYYDAKPDPTATYTVSSAATNVDVLNYRYVTVPAGSCKVNADTKSSVSTSLSGTTLTVEADVSPTVSAGWVSSGTGARIKIQGTVPTETKTITQNGTYSASSGKLISSVTVNINTSLQKQSVYVKKVNANRSVYTLTCYSQLYLSNIFEGIHIIGQLYCQYSGTGEDGDDDFDTPMKATVGYLDGNSINTILPSSGNSVCIGSLTYPGDTSGNLTGVINVYLIRKHNYIYIGTDSSYLYKVPNGSGTAPQNRILCMFDKVISCDSFYEYPFIKSVYNSVTLAGGTTTVSFAVAFEHYSSNTRPRTITYSGNPSMGGSIDHAIVYYDSSEKSLAFNS